MNVSKYLKDKTIIWLIGANLVPIIGVLFFKWDGTTIVFLYAVETFIIGIFNIAKMVLCKKINPQSQQKINKNIVKTILITFFIIHYNIFVIIQGIFILSIFGDHHPDFFKKYFFSFLINIGFLFISHGISFFKNYIKGKEYEVISLHQLMIAPYKRVFIQQFTVIFGIFFMILFNTPSTLLIVLVLTKIIFDIYSHHKSHILIKN